MEAKGLAALGTGLESIGKAAHEIKQSRDRFNLASAHARFETGVNDLAIKYDRDAGFADLPQRYGADVKALRNEVAGTLARELRDQFLFGSQRTVDRTHLAAWRRANSESRRLSEQRHDEAHRHRHLAQRTITAGAGITVSNSSGALGFRPLRPESVNVSRSSHHLTRHLR